MDEYEMNNWPKLFHKCGLILKAMPLWLEAIGQGPFAPSP